jgi:hypothetical protein
MANVTVRVRLDKAALNNELKGRTSPVAKTLSGFAGIATREIRGIFKQRAGGAWWPVTSTIADTTSNGMRLTVNVKSTRPHRIAARRAPVLRFKLADGATFVGLSVNHPGSSPPEELILTGIERAGRRVIFTSAAPRVTRPN